MKTQEIKKRFNIIWLFILILTLVVLFNVHFERYETTKEIFGKFSGWGNEQSEWVKVPNGIENIYCDEEIVFCDIELNPNIPFCYKYVSNVVGDWKSKYITFVSFSGEHSCVIEKKIKGWRVSIR